MHDFPQLTCAHIRSFISRFLQIEIRGKSVHSHLVNRAFNMYGEPMHSFWVRSRRIYCWQCCMLRSPNTQVCMCTNTHEYHIYKANLYTRSYICFHINRSRKLYTRSPFTVHSMIYTSMSYFLFQDDDMFESPESILNLAKGNPTVSTSLLVNLYIQMRAFVPYLPIVTSS